MFRKKLMEELAGSAVLFQHEDRIGSQLGKGEDLLLQIEIFLSGDEDILKFPDNEERVLLGQFRVRIVCHDEIHQIVPEKGDAAAGGGIDDPDADIRKFPVEPFEIRH